MDIKILIHHFEQGTLPKEKWKHDTHLKVALWYALQENDIWHAFCKIKAGIIVRNHSVDIQNSGIKGYHETITMFWVKEVYSFIAKQPDKNYNNLIEKLLSSEPFNQDHRDYIQQFYSINILKSTKARAIYIKPI